MLIHPDLQCLQTTVAQVTVKRRRDSSKRCRNWNTKLLMKNRGLYFSVKRNAILISQISSTEEQDMYHVTTGAVCGRNVSCPAPAAFCMCHISCPAMTHRARTCVRAPCFLLWASILNYTDFKVFPILTTYSFVRIWAFRRGRHSSLKQAPLQHRCALKMQGERKNKVICSRVLSQTPSFSQPQC